jgi:hypothetical protein
MRSGYDMRFKRRLMLLTLKYRIIEELSYWMGSCPSEVWGDYLTAEERARRDMSHVGQENL